VDRDEEVFDVAIGLLYLPLPQGRRIGILTDGGGIGVVAAEACESLGLELAPFSAKTMNALNDLLPPRWSHGNPVDIAIPKKRAVFDCLGAIMEDENVDAVILIGGLGAGVYIRELVGDEVATKGMIDKIREVMNEEEARGMEITSERMKELGKPLLVSYLIPKTAELDPPIYSQLPQQGIPVYPSPERAVKVLHHLSWYREYLNTREG
jgi:acyl-CoA synthetase (NDP forming)